MEYYIYKGELYHHGVNGQKWGIRRYQNPDGSLTAAGRKRLARQGQKELDNLDKEASEHRANIIRYDTIVRNRGAKITNADDIATDEKFRDAVAKRDAAEEALAYTDARTVAKIVELLDSGYDVSNKQIVRQTKAGERYTTQLLTGVIGTSAVTAVQARRYGIRYMADMGDRGTLLQTPWMVQGNKYTVRDTTKPRD